MKTFTRFVVLAGMFLGLSQFAGAALNVGDAAPDFTGTGSDGKKYHLADFAGKYVVLEWYNPGCPFIVKHYESSRNMQGLQDKYVKKGVVWLEINSSAPGREGNMTPAEAEAMRKKVGSNATATLLDPDGQIGMLYSAKTTPHMFVINPQGTLIYNGAIDDHNSPDAADIPKSKNYVSAALDQAMGGKKVTNSVTRPYGCSVKYK